MKFHFGLLYFLCGTFYLVLLIILYCNVLFDKLMGLCYETLIPMHDVMEYFVGNM